MTADKKDQTQLERINHLEHIVSKLLTHQRDLMAKFAWYWYDEKKKCLAIVTRIYKDEADLIAFSNTWSGGVFEVANAKILIRPEDKPEDELAKTGKWEPFLSLDEVLEEELAKLAAVAEKKKFKLPAGVNAGSSG